MSFAHWRQFHNCNAYVYTYTFPVDHKCFWSYETEICISAYREEKGKRVLLLWMRPNATHISPTTTRQLCRYLGESIDTYVAYAREYGTKPYMPVDQVRMMIAKGMIGDSTGVYARVIGSLSSYSDKALECAVDGR